MALFIDRLTAEGGQEIVGDDERAVVLEICRQLDGMPLAIERAAGRARTLGTSDVLSRLGERLRLLSGGWRIGVGRQQTLSATLDWSYVLLDEREQDVFDRLSVFVGSFNVHGRAPCHTHSVPISRDDALLRPRSPGQVRHLD